MQASRFLGWPMATSCIQRKKIPPSCERRPWLIYLDRTSTIGQLLYGRLSDIWSRKVILMIGLAVFFFGSLGSSMAQTTIHLVIFRCFTGVGGGGLMTVAQMIVSDVVPLRERGKYQGILVSVLLLQPISFTWITISTRVYNIYSTKERSNPLQLKAACANSNTFVLEGAVTALANGIGPVIGGALSSKGPDSWRWIFRLNLPLTVIAAACALFFMPLRKVVAEWRV